MKTLKNDIEQTIKILEGHIEQYQELIDACEKANETCLADFYKNKQRQTKEKKQFLIDAEIWNLV